jgi:hypothetical protein
MERFGNTDTFMRSSVVEDGYDASNFAAHLGQVYWLSWFVEYHEKTLVAHSGEISNFGTFTNFGTSGIMEGQTPVIHLSSNPVSGQLTVSYYSAKANNVDITLCNAAGMVVSHYNPPKSIGDQVARIDVSQLPAGIYFLTFRSAEGVRQEKVFVKR